MPLAPAEGELAVQQTGMPVLFQSYRLRAVTLRNRLVVSPMCQYSCEAQDGMASDWHLVHLGSRAAGGAGLIFTEAAAVTPEGRISPYDLGFWSDAHAEALARTVAFIRGQGAAIGIQLAHAGRKASTTRPWDGHRGVQDAEGGWTPVGPSTLAYSATYRAPREMSRDDIQATVAAFGDAAARANRVGFDVIEIHAAHGYLLHEFMSPLSNQRTDQYGGSFENRIRMTLDVVETIRVSWPASKPLFLRLSATDWVSDGWDIDDAVRLAAQVAKLGVDVIDCSSGGLDARQHISPGPGYQVPFAERIRRDAKVATGAVGLITTAEQSEQILVKEQADLIVIAREFLRDPYFPLHAAVALGAPDAAHWPIQYVRAK